MADIFLQKDMHSLIKNRKVLFVGDSNVRALYKDFLWLLHSNSLIDGTVLRRRLEFSCLGDKLVSRSSLTKGRTYAEHRIYEGKDVEVEFLFVTRCIAQPLMELLTEIRNMKKSAPTVLVMNSCLWDLTRWGPDGPADYRENMVRLVELLKLSLPKHTMVIWVTTPPTASTITGGLIIKQIEFMQEILRFEVLAANKFTSDLMIANGFDVIDFHFYLQFQIFRRSCDGVHYLPHPVRLMTNLILTHICLSWGQPLPGHVNNSLLDSVFMKMKYSTLEGCQDLANNVANVSDFENKIAEPNNNKKCLAPNNTPIRFPPNQMSKNAKRRWNRKIRKQNRNFTPYNRH